MRPPLEQNLSRTDQRALDKAIEVLDQMEIQRVENAGGYPGFANNAISGYVIYVTLNHDEEPEMEIYTVADLIAWYRRAKRFQRNHRGFDSISAMYETQGDDE